MAEATAPRSVLATEVELTFSCRNLLDRDVFSLSDPMCVVYERGTGEADWRIVHQTETLQDTLNPDFSNHLRMQYHFEEQQFLRFEIYDVDAGDEGGPLSKHDFLGAAETTLGKIVAAAGGGGSGQINQRMILPLEGLAQARGTMLVGAREITKADREQLVLQFHGRHLNASHVNKAFCCITSSAVPQFFVEVWVRRFQDVEETLITRFEPLEGSYPQWEPMKVGAGALHGGRPETPIRFICYITGKKKPMGELYSSINAIEDGMSAAKEFVMPIPKGKTGSGTCGELVVISFKREQVFTFLDYITSGTQIQCSIAIDFTASNGFPDSKKSLHFVGEDKQNLYEQALTAVCEVVQDYNSGNEYPVLGFGARLPPDGRVSHEFFVNFEDNPYCKGIKDVLEAYHQCVRKVEFWGPTNFSPVINHVASFAKMYGDGSQYFILLIITDGIITDMHKTKEALVAASVLPMSVIIVGVGGADFGDMVELDGDVVPLVGLEGQKAARDIVQFVPFSEFISAAAAISKGDENATAAKTMLAREVLAEVPAQVVSFMQGKKILPGQWNKKPKEAKEKE